jgi:hypothetical protein
MLQSNKTLSLFCVLLLFINLSLGDISTAQAKNPEYIIIPLLPDRWTATGTLEFVSSPNSPEISLDWKPKKLASFLQCKLNTKNFKPYNTLSIQLEQLTESKAWFFVYLHDEKHRSAMSYFQLTQVGQFDLSFNFLTLFSAFSHEDNFNWEKIHSIALLSHPDADLGIKETHLRIKQVKLIYQQQELSNFKLKIPESNSEAILIPHERWGLLRQNTDLYQTELGKNALQKLNQAINQLQTQDKLSLETLRDSAYGICLMDLSPQITETLLNKTLHFNTAYWKNLHQKNDILVQEEALYFIQIFDALKESIQNSQKYKSFFLDTLSLIAEIEKQTCLYWMQKYPFSQGNNHVTRAACILGTIALLGVQNPSQSKAWLTFSLQVLEYYLNFQISPEGVLNEGTHYYVYLMETLAPFSYFLSHSLHLNLFSDFSFSDRLQNLVLWTHQIETPEGFLPCIDDSWPSRVIFPKKFLYPFLHEQQHPWQWESAQDPWNLLKSSYFSMFFLNLELLLKSPNDEKSELSFPPHAVFSSDSQTVFRSQGKNHSYYLFLAGKNKFSLHEHDSAGSFQFFMDEKALINVSGYGPEGWTSQHRSYYVSAEAHNTLMIDRYGPKGYYNGGVGPIETTTLRSWQSNSTVGYAHMNINWNLRYPKLQHQRHFILMPDKEDVQGYLLLMDKLSATPSLFIQSSLHPSGVFLNQTPASSFFGQKNNLDTLIIKIQHLNPWKRELKKGWHSAYWGQESQKDYLQYSEQGKNFLSLLIQAYPQDLPSSITSTHKTFGSVEELYLEHNASSKSLSDTFFINPYQSIQQGKQMGSNAFFSHIRYNHRDMKLEECYLNDGSFLNCQQKGFFYSTRRISFSMQSSMQSDTMDGEYQLQYEASLPETRVFFYLDMIKEVWWGEETLPIEHHGDRISFMLPQGKHELRMISTEKRSMTNE